MAIHVTRLAAAAFVFLAGHVHAEESQGGIQVVMNEARIVKLARAADTIVVGNPAIADAAVQDAQTIVLTGKGFGVTNLVILDKDGAPIVDEKVMVSRNDDKTVRVYRRASVQTLSCTPSCEGAFKSEAESKSETEQAAE